MKILVVRFSSIGDIVLTTPVLRCLKMQTGAEVHFLTKKSFGSIMASNPYVDRVHVIEHELKEVARTLVQCRFDALIDLHGNLRTLELKIRLRTASLFSNKRAMPGTSLPPEPSPLRQRLLISTFDKLNFRKYLLTNFKIDRLPTVHIVQRYLAAASPLGIQDDGKGLDYFIPATDRIDLSAAGFPLNYVAFVIGAAHATKRLTEEQMRAFCETLPHPIILLGGPAEQATGERLATNLPHVINACGTYKLNGSADLVRQARLVVTHDTGLMHIAAAFNKDIISVWGNTVPAFGMYPYLPGREAEEQERRQEVVGLACRPCSKIGYAECPQGHFQCMREQSMVQLIGRCLEVLAN